MISRTQQTLCHNSLLLLLLSLGLECRVLERVAENCCIHLHFIQSAAAIALPRTNCKRSSCLSDPCWDFPSVFSLCALPGDHLDVLVNLFSADYGRCMNWQFFWNIMLSSNLNRYGNGMFKRVFVPFAQLDAQRVLLCCNVVHRILGINTHTYSNFTTAQTKCLDFSLALPLSPRRFERAKNQFKWEISLHCCHLMFILEFVFPLLLFWSRWGRWGRWRWRRWYFHFVWK